MADRPVTLDLGMPRLGGDPPAAQGGDAGAARDEDVSRFRQALGERSSGERGDEGREPGAAPGEAGSGARPSPFGVLGGALAAQAGGAFGLFGGLSDGGDPQQDASAGQQGQEAPAPEPGAEPQTLASPFMPLAALFSQGGAAPASAPQGSSHGVPLPPPAVEVVGAVAERILVGTDASQEVRVLIRNDVMPGVEVRILQEQGRWVMDFAVTDAASLGLLQSAGDRVAAELSRRLRKPVEVRVADPRRAQEQPDQDAGFVFVEDCSRETAAPVSGLPSINTRFPDEPR